MLYCYSMLELDGYSTTYLNEKLYLRDFSQTLTTRSGLACSTIKGAWKHSSQENIQKLLNFKQKKSQSLKELQLGFYLNTFLHKYFSQKHLLQTN